MGLAAGKPDIVQDLKSFLEDEVLGEKAPDLDSDTPLLELGILNSLSTARMIAFIRERYGLFVSAADIVGSNFRSLDRIADLVLTMSADPRAHV